MNKFFRALSRDNYATLMGSSIFTGIGAAVATVISPEFGMVVAGSAPVVGAGVGKLVQLIDEADWHYSCDYSLSKNSAILNRYKLVGPRADLKKIIRAQRYINRVNKKYQTLAVLPENVQAQIVKHIEDVQPLLESCTVLDDRTGSASTSFNFIRTFYGAKGTKEQQTLIQVELKSKIVSDVAFKPIVLPSVQDKKAQAEFDKAARLAEKNAEKKAPDRKLEL